MTLRSNRIMALKEILYYAGLFVILYLFYKSWWIIIPFIPLCVVLKGIRKNQKEEKRRKELNSQFRDMLCAMAAALRAGYSVENSIYQCRSEMQIIYGSDSMIYTELSFMINQIEMGISSEEIFREFAQRSGIEDIATFSSIFSIAKRTGGNMVEIIGKTSDDIAGRIDTLKEIDVMISAKKLENNIMTLFPAATILYIDITSPGLLAPLYGNIRGVLIMTACLAVYAAAAVFAVRIMNIEV